MQQLASRNSRKILLVQLLCACSFVLPSCNQPTQKKCLNVPKGVEVDSTGCPCKTLGHIHFYIDNSASMNGYFGKDAEFKTIISDLTAKVDKNIKPLDIWFISENVTKYPYSTERFSSDIATTKIADKDGYQLYDMIDSIAAKNDSNDISFLVSDCILSFPDSNIRKNPEISKTEAPNALKNDIFSTFSDLRKKGQAANIYAFSSKFYGTYYDYQNGKHKLTGDKRPFYIIVIGPKDLLGKFNSRLEDISTFKPEKSLHFGLSEEPVTKFNIIPGVEKKGNGMPNSSGFTEVNIKSDEPLQFCAVLNLDNLPTYAKEVSYLQKNLQLEPTGCTVVYEVKEKSKVDKSKLRSEPQIALLEKATHAVIFKVTEMPLSEAKVHVSLPLQYDTWYLDWSCMDDRDIAAAEGKTFALEYLVQGMKEAYETKNKNYIDFLITLNK